MNHKILFLLFFLIFFQCDKNNSPFPYEEEIVKMGMLRVVLDCPFEDCGPRYTLLNESLGIDAILIGDIDKNHSNLIVQVFGKNKLLTDEDRILTNYFGPIDKAIHVEKYKLISNINYHSFLPENARLYTIQKYGCFIVWNKSYYWKIIEDIPYIGVRMTNTFSDSIPFPFIEIWYNAKNGEFAKEVNSLYGIIPCEN